MIITLTLNPSVDETAWIDHLERGHVHRIEKSCLDPAGKGVNVSRVAHRLGCATIAFGFLAGDTGDIIEKALTEERVQHHFVRVPGETRVNFTFIERTGTATSFYGPGPEVGPESLEAMDELLRYWLRAGRVLVLAGSLPQNVPVDTYAKYVRAAREAKIRVFLDASGDALREGLAAGPNLIKPNVTEAEHLLGRELPDEVAIADAARELAKQAETVVISMGAKGAMCATGKRLLRVHAPSVEARSTVGSGDSMVAGLAIAAARGDDIEAALALGAAAGAATAMSSGTSLGTADNVRALVPRVRVEPWQVPREARDVAP